MHQARAANSPRILIVRLSAIGDVIHGVPVLCALRAALPESFLGWVVEGRSGSLLEGHPALDALVRVPRGWLKSPREVWRLRRQLHALRLQVSVPVRSSIPFSSDTPLLEMSSQRSVPEHPRNVKAVGALQEGALLFGLPAGIV